MADAAHEDIFDPAKHLLQCNFCDLGLSWKQQRQFGKSLRKELPCESHADWQQATTRPDPVDLSWWQMPFDSIPGKAG